MYVCIYIYVYVYIYICMYIYIYMYICSVDFVCRALRMTSIQSATLGELQQDQGQQCENLSALTSKLQSHRCVCNEAVGQICTEAKTDAG